MFAFVSAFPKSLHFTDEAQQAKTVLSAVLRRIIIMMFTRPTGQDLPIFLVGLVLLLFSADPQRLFLLLYILVLVPSLWTQGNCLGWGPSDRTGLAGLSTTGL